MEDLYFLYGAAALMALAPTVVVGAELDDVDHGDGSWSNHM